ncbi:MAG: ABC transporter permease subunit, partial [Planctomycetaceae bacterium]|nr:ABC transporter permease subunit [Planctomycetaceae bacterium]
SDQLVALVNNKCDATFIDDDEIVHVLKEFPNLDYCRKPATVTDIAFAFPKKPSKYREQFNEFLKEFRQNGELDKMIKGWSDDNDAMPTPQITGNGNAGTIRFAVTGDVVPFAYYRNGKLVGSDIDLLYRFASKYNYHLEPFIANFSGILAALGSNRVDVAACCISITEERKKIVNFSDPYRIMGNYLFFRKNELASYLKTGVTKENQPPTTAQPVKHAAVTELNPSAFDGKRLGVLSGNIMEKFCAENFPKSKIVVYNTKADQMLALVTNKCDATFFENDEIAGVLKNFPQFDYIRKPPIDTDIAFAFSKKQSKYREQFNEFLKELRQSGELDKMIKDWGEDHDAMPTPQITGNGSAGTIRFAATGDMVPITFYRNGKLVGSDIDLLYRFASKYNYDVEPFVTNFAGLITALGSNRVDIACCCLTITEERSKIVDFSDPYRVVGEYIFVRKSELASYIKTGNQQQPIFHADDFAEKRIGILIGSVYDNILDRNYPKAVRIYLESRADQLLSLEHGQCDAIMYSDDTIYAAKKEHPNITVIYEPLIEEPIGFAFPKGHSKYREQFNELLKELDTKRELQAIYEGWNQQFDTMPIPDFGGDGSAGTLRFGTTTTDMPPSFVRNGKVAGYDIDLMARFATKYNYKVEIVRIPFGGLLAALGSGKIDIAGSSIMITPERQKKVDFSIPYAMKKVFFIIRSDYGLTPEQVQTMPSIGWRQSIVDSFKDNLLAENRYLLLVNGFKVTVWISLWSVVLGTLLGAVVCFMEMHRNLLLRRFADIYVSLVRGIPMLVFLMLMFYVILAKLPVSAVTVAIISFGINFSAYVSQMFKTSVESIPVGQTEAGIAMGFSRLQTFWYIVLPQAIKQVLPIYNGEVISLIKMTSIVGYIAVEDLTKASDIIRSRTFDAFFPLILIAIIYFILAWIAARLLEKVALLWGVK